MQTGSCEHRAREGASQEQAGATQFSLAAMLVRMVRLWAGNPLGALWRVRRLVAGFLGAGLRRRRRGRRDGVLVPMGIGLSPTMRCNLNCVGCYARFHPRQEEMPFEVIQCIVASAEKAGVFLFVITGGEPYIRPEMLDLYRAHPRSCFLTVSNGTLIDEPTARAIAGSGNVFPMISIEGDEAQTDERRGKGVYRRVLACMQRLHAEGVLFGFSAVVTRKNAEILGSDRFVADMVARGCSAGFYNDLIPVDPEDLSLLPESEQAATFRARLGRLRRRYPILLVHLPDDEYDGQGRCLAVSGGAMHINALGFAEPCPFAQYARENLCSSSFEEALRSPFLRAIREHPTVLIHGAVGCSLVSNSHLLHEIAGRTGARPTRPIFRDLSGEALPGH
jgi:MoaA/NifB/PqqE/SkfB family radical SAM enzyme